MTTTINPVVHYRDLAAGANFLVEWAATSEIAEPAVEALMVGGVANAHYAFISQGRPTRTAGKK